MLDVEVMSRREAGHTLTGDHRFQWVISIGDPLTGPCEGFDAFPHEKSLNIEFDDVSQESSRFGYQRATVGQVKEIVDFCKRVDGPCLVHCEAGISRSAAVAIILCAVKLGPGNEREAVATVAEKGITKSGGNIYCPNEWLIYCADRILSRGNDLVHAFDGIWSVFENGLRFAPQQKGE